MRHDMLRCGAHTAVRSAEDDDDDDDQPFPELQQYEPGDYGTVTYRSRRLDIWGLIIDKSTDRWISKGKNGRETWTHE